MSSVSTYDALKETLTFQYQIHINFPASARVPFFLNTIMDPEPEATLISEVFTQTAKNTFFPLWNEPDDVSGVRFFCQSFHKGGSQNLLCYTSLISYLTTPFPCSPAILCVKKHLLEEQRFAPDDSLTSSLSVSVSPTDTKNFNAFLLTTCT